MRDYSEHFSEAKRPRSETVREEVGIYKVSVAEKNREYFSRISKLKTLV